MGHVLFYKASLGSRAAWFWSWDRPRAIRHGIFVAGVLVTSGHLSHGFQVCGGGAREGGRRSRGAESWGALGKSDPAGSCPVCMRGCETNGRAWFAETAVSRRAAERESRAAGQAGATKPQPVSRCSDGEREATLLAMDAVDVGRRRQVGAGDGQEKER